MGCRLLRSAALALSLLAVPMLGCEPKPVQIQLDAFGSSGIEGIFLYRQNPAGGTFQRTCEIRFSDFRTIERRGQTVERIKYVQNCVDGEIGTPALLLETTVRRPGNDPDAILLELWYLRFEDPGTYRASAFNAAGESALSAASLPL